MTLHKSESEFIELADRTLESLAEALEAADAAGKLDVECENGMLSLDLAGGRQLLVSRHTPMRQLWLSSPVTGGLHFSPAEDGSWQLPDGRSLHAQLESELKNLAGLEVSLS